MEHIDGIIEGIEKYANEPSTTNVLQLKTAVDLVTYIVNLVLGIIVWGLVVLFTLVTVMDLLYLTIPFFRSSVQKTGLAGREKKTGLRLVSHDADKAIERAALKESVSPLVEYLKIRIKTYVFVACMLTVLLCGGWEWIKDFLQPIVVAIVSLFY